MDQHRLSRLVELITILESHRFGCTLADMSKAFGVHTRTIRRDLDALQEAGIPIYDDEKDGEKRWFLVWSRTRGGKTVRLSFQELVALAFVERFCQSQVGRPFQDALRTALDKVRILSCGNSCGQV